MGGKRRKGGPERSDATVRLDKNLLSKAKLAAEHKGLSLAEYLTEACRPIVDRDFDEAVRALRGPDGGADGEGSGKPGDQPGKPPRSPTRPPTDDDIHIRGDDDLGYLPPKPTIRRAPRQR